MKHALFFFPRFNRLVVLLPMLAAIGLVIATFFVTEDRRNFVRMLSERITASQQRLSELGELIYACADAESSQRGFLLTDQPKYLDPFAGAKAEAYRLVDVLEDGYRRHRPDLVDEISELRRYVDSKFSEMEITIDLARGPRANRNAVSVIKTDVGLVWMTGLRARVSALQKLERDSVQADIRVWDRQMEITRVVSGVGALLNVLLLLYAGALVTRDITRREKMNTVLDERVTERTAELAELSQHMLGSTERQKTRLARELHDELGGLLVAIKMDLAQLGKKLDMSDSGVQVRWDRIQAALASGIELKRRVIEELHPTLLDNMGMCAALRWQAEQICEAAGMKLHLNLPEAEVPLRPDVGIAIFRVAQESLTNIAKHADADQVWVSLVVCDHELVITIEDDGVGMGKEGAKVGAHGLLGMKHRMLAVGGSVSVEESYPRGVRVTVHCPTGV